MDKITSSNHQLNDLKGTHHHFGTTPGLPDRSRSQKRCRVLRRRGPRAHLLFWEMPNRFKGAQPQGSNSSFTAG